MFSPYSVFWFPHIFFNKKEKFASSRHRGDWDGPGETGLTHLDVGIASRPRLAATVPLLDRGHRFAAMNSAMKSALVNSKNTYMSLRAALFHSTPVLYRKRRNHWDSKFNHYSKRCRRIHAKQTLLRNMNAYADFLLQSWKDEINGDDPSSSQGTSWFRKDCSARGCGRNRNGNKESRYYRRRNSDSDFPEEDFDVETIFRSSFGGNRFFYYSFISEEHPQWRRSGRYSSYSRSWNWSEDDEYYDSSTESDNSDSNLASDRLALGLNAHGPLKAEDVKNAYRSCALKWHPDRHQGASKVIAEEKFKVCSAAYQSLCDKLAIN